MKSYVHFPAWELKCHCGKCPGGGSMDEGFMTKLIALRKEVGPLPIVSAYRCSDYNLKVSSTGVNGPHTTGEAVDIACTTGSRRMQLVAASLRHGFSRVGVAKNFVHIDSLTEVQGFPVQVMWTY